MKAKPLAQILSTALLVTATAWLAVPQSSAAQATDDAGEKTVRSAGGRAGASPRERSSFVERETFATERPRRNTANGKGDSTTAAAVIEEAWIYDADIELFDDYDSDGYYTFLRVTFDTDSIYAEHWVYARLFVTIDGVTWDEYHITDDFLVEGTSPFDDYEVETELLTGFPAGLYDVLIEIYDADLGHFLGEFGPVQSSAFSLVPLEDVDRDYVEPVVVVTTEHGGGGATGLPALAGLSILVGLSRRLRRRRA